MTAWQDIATYDTVLEDERDILVWVSYDDDVSVGYAMVAQFSHTDEEGVDHYYPDGNPYLTNVTHWAPIEPPTSEES